MKKKFAAMFMAAAMVFTMAACGQKADTPSTPDADASGDQSTADVQTFKIGSCGPLTGDAAIYGQAVVNGAELAVNEINASDSKTKFEFQKQDDEADGEKAANAYNTMMDWDMQVLVGPTTTGASLTVSELCYNDRTFMLTPSASSTDVTSGKDNVFQVCFTDPNQGVSAADYMSDNYADAKIAIIYRNDDAYSQGIRDAFKAEAADKGLSVVYEGTFTNDTASDFSVQLTAAQTAGADVVFLPIYYQPASVIFSQANAMGYAPTFFGVDGIDLEHGITTSTIDEAKLTRKMMKASSQNIVLADSSKFGQRGFGRICALEDIDVIITDDRISEQMVAIVEEAGVDLIIVK